MGRARRMRTEPELGLRCPGRASKPGREAIDRFFGQPASDLPSKSSFQPSPFSASVSVLTSAAKARDLVELQRGFGLDDVELLSGDEARARWPYLAPSIVQARFRAGDGFIDQVALARGYATASSRASQIPGATGSGHAQYALSVEVTGFIRGESGAITGVETSRGGVHTPAVMIAAGPWSGNVAALAGLALPIAPTIRQKPEWQQ